jgi:hypothetical protein
MDRSRRRDRGRRTQLRQNSTLVSALLLVAVIAAVLVGLQPSSSQEVLLGTVASVQSACAPMSCGSQPLTETNRVCPMLCMLSYRVELVVHLGPPGSMAPDRLYEIYIVQTGAANPSELQMRAADLKPGDQISILAHPAGYCACGDRCNDCWIANDSDWQYASQTTTWSCVSYATCTGGNGAVTYCVCMGDEATTHCMGLIPSECQATTTAPYVCTTTWTHTGAPLPVPSGVCQEIVQVPPNPILSLWYRFWDWLRCLFGHCG